MERSKRGDIHVIVQIFKALPCKEWSITRTVAANTRSSFIIYLTGLKLEFPGNRMCHIYRQKPLFHQLSQFIVIGNLYTASRQ